MERKHRHLDGERQEKCREEPERRAPRQSGTRREQMIVAEVRRCARSVAQMQTEIDDRHQHQERWQEGVDEELDAGVDAPFPAPYADDKVHRHQHHFPHHVEQEKIAREEHANHAAAENQEQRVVAADLGANARPAAKDRQRHDEGGQQHHHQGDAIDAQRKANPPRGNPGLVDRSLPALVRWVERPPEAERDDEFEDKEPERELSRGRTFGGNARLCSDPRGQQQYHHRSEQRDGQQSRQYPAVVSDRVEKGCH